MAEVWVRTCTKGVEKQPHQDAYPQCVTMSLQSHSFRCFLNRKRRVQLQSDEQFPPPFLNAVTVLTRLPSGHFDVIDPSYPRQQAVNSGANYPEYLIQNQNFFHYEYNIGKGTVGE